METSSASSIEWRNAAVQAFRYHKSLAERAVAQIGDEALHRELDANVNSIAVIMQHVAGNLRSRWTDFLVADGEKPWRDRDAEFVDRNDSREELLADWEDGWKRLFDSLERLSPEEMGRTVVVRGEPHCVPLAVERSLAHASYHVGQIVFLARHWAGDVWQTLTIPRGGSAAHNAAAWSGSDYKRRASG